MLEDDVAKLQRENPSWQISSVWTSAASGPDCRRLVAYRYTGNRRVLLTAGNAGELRAKIAREEDSP